MDINVVKSLAEVGTAGIAVLLAWILYRVVTNHFEHTNKVIDRNTKAWTEQSGVLERLVDLLDRNLNK